MSSPLDLHESVLTTVAAYGSTSSGLRRAHTDSLSAPGLLSPVTRREREEALARTLAPGATRPVGPGQRARAEEADPYLLCFESDLERIRYSPAFRRLAGKCQVFVTPRNDMLRTRLTHTVEVAAVATRVADALGLCVPLAEAIATGHDCGHGPGGHAAEEALSPYLPEGFDHAVWGADVVLAPLNLCAETLDGIRNHSWKRPAPMTFEGEVVSWADRIAYVVADHADAVRAGILRPEDLPADVIASAGSTHSEQLRFFCGALERAARACGEIGMLEEDAAVLDAFRRYNFERIYLRPGSLEQAERVVAVLQALTEFYIDAPGQLPDVASGQVPAPASGSPEAAFESVRYVASMTDRFAFDLATRLLNWPAHSLPRPL